MGVGGCFAEGLVASVGVAGGLAVIKNLLMICAHYKNQEYRRRTVSITFFIAGLSQQVCFKV
jgi:hypothetical protein